MSDGRTVLAHEAFQAGFSSPYQDGQTLAAYLVNHGLADVVTEIDVRQLSASLLTSTFVNSLLHALQQAGCSVGRYRALCWISQYPSEETAMREYVELYLDSPLSKGPV